jgi:pimeloyl-ACP methyl ester carboxylesterase
MNTYETNGIKLAYTDKGSGETLVIVHGTPTNSSEYDAVIESLSAHCRCVAIDHLGFGDSDKPLTADYSIAAHRARLISLLQHLNIETFHLLVHDFGGVIGLPLVLNGAFKVKTVTILNSWIWPLVETEPTMKNQRWLVRSGVFPLLYRQFNFSAKYLVKLAWGTSRPLSHRRHESYMAQFPTPSSRTGTVSFLQSLFDFDDPVWKNESVLLKLTQMKVQIIWGLSDKLVTEKTLARWQQKLPGAEIHRLSTTGHFVAEESPEEVAEKLLQALI